MSSEAVWFCIVYIIFCIYMLTPPTEFVTAGVTLTQLLSTFLEAEDQRFIEHNIQRSTLLLVVHSLLPLGFFLGFAHLVDDPKLVAAWQSHWIWQCGIALSVIIFTMGCVKAFYYSLDDWSRHPVVKRLTAYGRLDGERETGWREVASRINTEYRQVDKFISGPPHSLSRSIVTDSWILKVTPYDLNLCHQSDARLELVSSAEQSVSQISSTGVQFLDIRVYSRRDDIKPFTIRVNSLEYNDLRTKLQAPLENVRHIVIHRSLSDRFTDAFRSQVERNERFTPPADMEREMCIGCMQTPANVKLRKRCDDTGVGQCQTCFCRPMWCVECMARWFASRQDQSQTETWLSSHCPCPTCRSVFCVLDVSLVEDPQMP